MPISQAIRNAICFAGALTLLYLAMMCGACMPSAQGQAAGTSLTNGLNSDGSK